MQFTSISYSI